MKNITLLLFGLIVILGAVLWYLKPVEASSKPPKVTQEQLLPVEQQHATVTDPQKTLIEGEKPHLNTPSSEVALVDTKSDLSIQPIDPETDPGNQILKNN